MFLLRLSQLIFIRRGVALFTLLSLVVACTPSSQPGVPRPAIGTEGQPTAGSTAHPAKEVPRPPVTTTMSVPLTRSDGVTDPPASQRFQPGGLLQQALESFLAGLDGTYGIAAYNFLTGETIRINESELFSSASLYKLIVLYEAYRQAEAGKIRLTDTLEIRPQDLVETDDSDLQLGEQLSVDDALHLMITVSSNAAAYAVLNKIGWKSFNEAAAQLGLSDTYMPAGNEFELYPEWRRRMVSTSPRDMLSFFELLARRRLVSASASNAMLRILLDQQVNDRIPAGLPDDVLIAHKTGELYGVRNDAGVIFTDSNAYILVVLTSGPDVDEQTAAIAEIARLVHARFR